MINRYSSMRPSNGGGIEAFFKIARDVILRRLQIFSKQFTNTGSPWILLNRIGIVRLIVRIVRIVKGWLDLLGLLRIITAKGCGLWLTLLVKIV